MSFEIWRRVVWQKFKKASKETAASIIFYLEDDGGSRFVQRIISQSHGWKNFKSFNTRSSCVKYEIKNIKFRSLKCAQSEHSRLKHFRMHFCPTMDGTEQSFHTEEDTI